MSTDEEKGLYERILAKLKINLQTSDLTITKAGRLSAVDGVLWNFFVKEISLKPGKYRVEFGSIYNTNTTKRTIEPSTNLFSLLGEMLVSINEAKFKCKEVEESREKQIKRGQVDEKLEEKFGTNQNVKFVYDTFSGKMKLEFYSDSEEMLMDVLKFVSDKFK